MRYGFVIPGGDARLHPEYAQEIEAAGWDGVFIAEMLYGTDAWVSLGAMAAKTSRVRLGTLLTPPSRRRPWKLASEVATLDQLSQGRALLSVGLGALDTGFAEVGEVTDRKARAELLDESLELLTRFWSGEPFQYKGKHFDVTWGDQWLMKSMQSPRVPIWVAAAWPREKSLQRALRWDGIMPNKMNDDGYWGSMTPDDIRELTAYIAAHRTDPAPLDIIIEGVTPIGDQAAGIAQVRAYAEAGATWWIESMWTEPGGMEAVLQRIRQGPPREE